MEFKEENQIESDDKENVESKNVKTDKKIVNVESSKQFLIDLEELVGKKKFDEVHTKNFQINNKLNDENVTNKSYNSMNKNEIDFE